ncbi:MAG TPA: formate/nitrite transporter family protein [Longimicrobiales bacterium]
MSEQTHPHQRASEEQATSDIHAETAFHHSVKEGEARTSRSLNALIATGLMGGVDVSVGVLAFLVTKEQTGSTVAAALAFSIGFIVLVLAHSELFTENYLHPVTAWVARKASTLGVLRLWAGTLVFNLVGGWLFSWLIVWGLPNVHTTAIEVGSQLVSRSNGELVALGIMAGMAITLLTWIEESAKSTDFGRTATAIGIAFVLLAAHLNHIIVVSIELFVALNTGSAPFGYDDWLRVAGIALVTNLVGGVALVTGLRILQAGREGIERERHRGTGHVVTSSRSVE